MRLLRSGSSPLLDRNAGLAVRLVALAAVLTLVSSCLGSAPGVMPAAMPAGKGSWGWAGDARLDYQFTDWSPQSLDGADLETEGLDLGALELDIEIHTPIEGYVFAPKTLRYEFTLAGDNDLNREIIELQARRRQSYTRFLAELPLYRYWGKELKAKLRKFQSERWGWYYNYEAFAFTTEMRLEEDKRFVPLSGNSVALNAGDTVQGATVFEQHELLFRHELPVDEDGIEDGDAGRVGLFYLEYGKPYSVEVLGNPQPETLREGQFEAIGLSFGLELNYFAEHEDFDLRCTTMADLGHGDIDFANGLDIQDFIPPSKSVFYGGASVELESAWACAENVSVHLGALYRYHYFGQWPPWDIDEIDDLFESNDGRYDLNDDHVWGITFGIRGGW